MQVDLVVNANGIACWSGNPLLTSTNENLSADTLRNVPIK